MSKSSKFSAGLVIGAVAGALAALFLTPKTGKEMQEVAKTKLMMLKEKLESGEFEQRVLDIFGGLHGDSKKIYMETREEVINAYKKIKEIDYDKYVDVVNEAVEKIAKKFKESEEITVDSVEKLKEDLMSEAEGIAPKSKKKPTIN